MRFEEILVILTALTGIICLANYVYHKWRKQSIKGKKQNWIIEYSKSFFPVLILVLFLRTFLVEPFRIPTGSMKPTLVEGDFILVNKYQYGLRLPILGTKLVKIGAPNVGDIVVFRHRDGKDLIKRVVGVPGDHVQYFGKKLYINGQQVPTEEIGSAHDRGIFAIESREDLASIEHSIYVYPQVVGAIYPYNDVIVPPGSYFVLGDNRDNSEDGRYFGFVNEQDLLGKAFATWMSWDSESDNSLLPIRWSRIGKSVYTYPDKNA